MSQAVEPNRVVALEMVVVAEVELWEVSQSLLGPPKNLHLHVVRSMGHGSLWWVRRENEGLLS